MTNEEHLKAEYYNKINSITKHVEQPNLHHVNESCNYDVTAVPKELSVVFGKDEDIYCYEKIEGRQAKIIFFPESREEEFAIALSKKELFFKNEAKKLFNNKAMRNNHYAKLVYAEAEKIQTTLKGNNLKNILVCYFILTNTNGHNFRGRLFDVCEIPISDYLEMLCQSKQTIAYWREYKGGHRYYTTEECLTFAQKHDVEMISQLPIIKGADVNKSLLDTYNFALSLFKETQLRADDDDKVKVPNGIIMCDEFKFARAQIHFPYYKRLIQNKLKKCPKYCNL